MLSENNELPSFSPGCRLERCPVCDSPDMRYAFCIEEQRYESCDTCSLVFANPLPGEAELAAIYGSDYYLGHGDLDQSRRTRDLKRASAGFLLNLVGRYGSGRKPNGLKLLDIGCGPGHLLAEAEAQGFDATGIDVSPEAVEQASKNTKKAAVLVQSADNIDLPSEAFDVCVLSDSLEHVLNPRNLMDSVWKLLRPEGIVLVATPSLISWSRRLMKEKWLEFKKEHLTYFMPSNLQMLLYKSGFIRIEMHNLKKALNLEYIHAHFERYPTSTFWQNSVKAAFALLPSFVKQRKVLVSGSGMIALATKSADAPHNLRKVSIIVPAYNERSTFPVLMERLLQKQLPGLTKEVIVVESNSDDGTREVARQFESHPEVHVVFQEKPEGKGYAVRTGFKYATGDIILIQDADLEYDLHDYESLLRPLVLFRTSFVLGSRHSRGTMKMRRFEDNPLIAGVINCGHYLLTFLFNALYGQRLRDPFTMFKVFRSDCIQRLDFRCNRFDFDIELVIALLKRGFEPVEIPVNYVSRSFKQGKKVSFLNDPLRILGVMLRNRVQIRSH